MSMLFLLPAPVVVEILSVHLMLLRVATRRYVGFLHGHIADQNG